MKEEDRKTLTIRLLFIQQVGRGINSLLLLTALGQLVLQLPQNTCKTKLTPHSDGEKTANRM